MNVQGVVEGLQRWPLALPENFLRRIGYHLVTANQRRYVGLYWEPCGDEAAHEDGLTSSVGCLSNSAWLNYFHRIDALRACDQHGWDFGSSEDSARHWLIVDRESNQAWVAPIELGRRIVREQLLMGGTQ